MGKNPAWRRIVHDLGLSGGDLIRLAVLPEGRRRHALQAAARAMFADDFEGRVLPFDTAAAEVYATIFSARRRMGLPIVPLDLMIATVARASNAGIVTHDTASSP